MVTLRQDFYLGDREVTVRQFREFVQKAADQTKCTDAEKEIAKSWRGEDTSVSQFEEDCPVQLVSWYGAVAFCNWVSRCEGLTSCYSLSLSKTGPDGEKDWKCDFVPQATGYRLPSEAQWEYACRAVSQTQYAFGDDERLLAEYGDYGRNSEKRTWPAGGKLPNGWGLFDMHGNVWEWCQDWYAEDYYAKSPASDPLGAREAGLRVIRGGSYWDSAGLCRSAYRSKFVPRLRYVLLGFRVAAVPQGESSSGPGSR